MKLKFIYKWGINHTPAKWFVKADDDQFIRVNSLNGYLKSQYDPDKYTVIGNVAYNKKVRRSGKWAEISYKNSSYGNATYPPFPLGHASHIISRKLAAYIAENSARMFEYSGEDTSLGIWIDESPLRDRVEWVNSKRLASNRNCNDTSFLVIGHKIWPSKMRDCYAHKDEVF